MVSSTAAVVAVLLLSLLGLGQADVNPGDSAIHDIQFEISEGVREDKIYFKKPFGHGVLRDEDGITKSQVCSKLVAGHNKYNAEFLQGVTVEWSDCMDAMAYEQEYTYDQISEWTGVHCGTLTNMREKQQQLTVANNIQCEIVPSGSLLFQSQCVYNSRKGQPACIGFIETETRAATGPSVSFQRTIFRYLHIIYLCFSGGP